MTPFVSELVGTALLIIFGNGVVANVVLSKSKGNNGGWIVIAFGWAIAVFIGVYTSGASSGAHLNPAVTIALAVLDNSFEKLYYIPAQLLGAMIGSTLVWVAYKQHYDETDDAEAKLATFCTGPAIPHVIYNYITEVIVGFALMFSILMLGQNKKTVELGALDALPVALVVLAIGLSLGGPTGYAANPARDLGPRIMHAILPIPKKRDSNWGYSWIPVMGPSLGMVLAVLLYKAINIR
jgi:glycerol uptake facilitator protein